MVGGHGSNMISVHQTLRMYCQVLEQRDSARGRSMVCNHPVDV